MATVNNASLFVVPTQPAPAAEPISQAEIALLLSLRGRLHQLEAQVESAEKSILQRLQNGAGVELGDYSATLHTSFRRNVSWKSACERLAERFKLDGAAFTARVLAATKQTPIVSLELR